MAAVNLPPELWDSILTFAAENDFIGTWTHGRQVCHAWNSAITQIYRDIYLRDHKRFTVYFDPEEDFEPEPGYGKVSFAVEMIFDRFDTLRPWRCVFSENLNTTGQAREWTKEAYEDMYEATKTARWRSRVLLYQGPYEEAREEGGMFYAPAHVIRLIGLRCPGGEKGHIHNVDEQCAIVNDTELSGLEVDFDRREISFDWIAMFDAFFAEAAELRRRNDAPTAESEREAWRVTAQASEFDTVHQASDLTSQKRWHNLRNRKDVRRERVRKFYLKRHGRDFFDEDWRDVADIEEDALRKIARREGWAQNRGNYLPAWLEE